jgi:hypothetical protein
MADAVDFLNSAQAAAHLQIDIRTLGALAVGGQWPMLLALLHRCVKYRRADLISVCRSTVSRLPATESEGK